MGSPSARRGDPPRRSGADIRRRNAEWLVLIDRKAETFKSLAYKTGLSRPTIQEPVAKSGGCKPKRRRRRSGRGRMTMPPLSNAHVSTRLPDLVASVGGFAADGDDPGRGRAGRLL